MDFAAILKIETNKEVCIAKIIQEASRRPYDKVAAEEKWVASRILRFWWEA